MILIDTNMNENKKKYYTIKEAAQYLKVTPLTIKRYLANNQLISYKISGSRRIDSSVLETYVDKKKNKEIFESLEKNIKIILNNNLKNLVNFSENLKLPTHRWFNIKEGYSEELVNNLIKKYKIKKGLVIDPFLGSGTTAIAAAKNNLNFLGFEINPFLAFLASNKIMSNSFVINENYFNEIISLKLNKKAKRPKLTIIDKVFKENLECILTIKEFIDTIPDKNNKNFYKLVFLCALEASSYAKKDGNGLKYPKHKKTIDFKESFKNKYLEMKNDSKKFLQITGDNNIYNLDSRNIISLLKKKLKIKTNDLLGNHPISHIKKYVNKAKLAVFSPPYMNCFDYTEVYKIELWMGGFVKSYDDLKLIRADSLSSHLNKKYIENFNYFNPYVNYFTSILKNKYLWDKKIILMINEYFHDMENVMEGIYELLEDKGKCVIVVGNSAYASIAIPTDLLLAKIGEKIGFKKIKIEIARNLGTSSQQYKTINNIDLLRESLVILEK